MPRLAISFLCLILTACSQPDNSWYPLEEGYWWQYAVTRYVRGERRLQKSIEAMLEPRNIDSESYYPKKRADGRTEYFQKREGSVYRFDPETKTSTLILKGPVELGTSWHSPSRIRFLEVTGAFEQTYNRRIKQAIDMEYRIDSIDDIVTVPAGKFSNSIRVKGTGSLYGGGGSLKEFMDLDTINIETIDWYVPGVGLVKSMRKEFTFPVKFENNYLEVLEIVRKDS